MVSTVRHRYSVTPCTLLCTPCTPLHPLAPHAPPAPPAPPAPHAPCMHLMHLLQPLQPLQPHPSTQPVRLRLRRHRSTACFGLRRGRGYPSPSSSSRTTTPSSRRCHAAVSSPAEEPCGLRWSTASTCSPRRAATSQRREQAARQDPPQRSPRGCAEMRGPGVSIVVF